MLSTQYRLKLEAICEKIVKGESVELSEMTCTTGLSVMKMKPIGGLVIEIRRVYTQRY